MTTETTIEQPVVEDAAASWDQGVKALEPVKDDPPPQQTEQEAAPSTEGVVTSEAPKTEQPKTEEAPKRNLGRLSTDELLAMVASGDPDAPRAIELRLRRNENQPKRQNKELADLEQRGAAAKQGIDRLAEDYPDIAAGLAPMKDFVDATTAPLREAERQFEAAQAEAKIEKVFPGFVSVARSPELMEWLRTQPDDVKHDFQRGGVDGAINVLDAFDTHVKAQGKPSPFAPPESAPAPAPAAPDKAARAAQIVERRQQILKNSAAIPSGARSSLPAPESDAVAAWNAGVALVNQSKRN